MAIREKIKSGFPGLYRLLLRLYRVTPLYNAGLKRDLATRRRREAIFLKELFASPPSVCAGPFAGLHYLEEASGSVLLPKLLGTYEAALHPWIAEAQRSGYETLLDVGCAEGYYAVGFAATCPALRVLAYDLNPSARALCQRMAEANGVADQIAIREQCDAAAIKTEANGKTLVICDIEGAEYGLLDPEKIPALLRLDIIVEAHDHLNPDITPTLLQRFRDTHEMDTVSAAAPSQDFLKPIAHLSKEDQQFILDEQRTPEMVWHRFRVRA